MPQLRSLELLSVRDLAAGPGCKPIWNSSRVTLPSPSSARGCIAMRAPRRIHVHLIWPCQTCATATRAAAASGWASVSNCSCLLQTGGMVLSMGCSSPLWCRSIGAGSIALKNSAKSVNRTVPLAQQRTLQRLPKPQKQECPGSCERFKELHYRPAVRSDFRAQRIWATKQHMQKLLSLAGEGCHNPRANILRLIPTSSQATCVAQTAIRLISAQAQVLCDIFCRFADCTECALELFSGYSAILT